MCITHVYDETMITSNVGLAHWATKVHMFLMSSHAEHSGLDDTVSPLSRFRAVKQRKITTVECNYIRHTATSLGSFINPSFSYQ